MVIAMTINWYKSSNQPQSLLPSYIKTTKKPITITSNEVLNIL